MCHLGSSQKQTPAWDGTHKRSRGGAVREGERRWGQAGRAFLPSYTWHTSDIGERRLARKDWGGGAAVRLWEYFTGADGVSLSQSLLWGRRSQGVPPLPPPVLGHLLGAAWEEPRLRVNTGVTGDAGDFTMLPAAGSLQDRSKGTTSMASAPIISVMPINVNSPAFFKRALGLGHKIKPS